MTWRERFIEHALWIRWAAAAVGAFAVASIAPENWTPQFRFLLAWDIALAISVVLPWWIILRSNSVRSRLLARYTDPGNIGLLLVSVLVSAASVLGVVLVLGEPSSGNPRDSLVGNFLVITAIFGGWTLLQTAFTLHYARVYYADANQPGGLDFPGGAPDDLDFAYFAFGIGVACQVSDVSTTNRQMRRLVLVQSVLAFVYNLAILGLMVNLLAGRL